MARKQAGDVRGVFQRTDRPGEWWIRYQHNGKTKRERVGPSKQDAIDLYQQRKTELRAGAKLPDNLRAKIRFGTLIDDILVYSERKHKDTRNVKSRCEIVREEFGTWVAEDIQPENIEAWLHERSKTPATFNIYRSLFSLIFRQAMRNQKAKRNPARDVEMRRVKNARIRFLSRDEQSTLQKVIRERCPDRWHEVVISLGTGMRLSEQYGLEWQYVNFRDGLIDLRETKNGKAREIDMSPAVRAAFQALYDASEDTGQTGKVFPTKHPRKWFNAALVDAKISGYRWHDNRHTFCSRLAQSGAHIKTIQELAGHETIQMSARYATMDRGTKRKAVEAVL